MARYTAVLFCWLWAIAGVLGCGESQAGHDGGGDQPGARDAGNRASSAPDDRSPRTPDELPLLCASCMPQPMPGGDTTDFGQVPARTCQDHQRGEGHVIPVEQAEAAGFDFTQQLAAAEGRHEFPVRWTDPARPAPTVLEVDVRTTGRASVTTWSEVTPTSTSTLPPCPWIYSDSAALEVEVRVATADHAVAGTFTGILWFSLSGPTVGPPVWQWGVQGDGSSLRGELEFPADPPDPHRLVADVRVLHYIDGALGDRGDLSLSLLHDIPESLWMVQRIQEYGALPLDGCWSGSVPPEPVPPPCAEPLTRAKLNCCVPAVHFLPDAGIADEDAGAAP